MVQVEAAQSAGYPFTEFLYMALELSATKWRLAFSRTGERVKQSVVAAGDVAAVLSAIAHAKQRFALPAEARVLSCYEAGRDGFWIDRLLCRLGIENIVIDAASMKVNRRRRRAKSDRIDGNHLVIDLVRHCRGDRDVWKVVRVPSETAEDGRRVSRELGRLKKERTQHRVRVLSLLALHGIRPEGSLARYLEKLDEAKIWDGSVLPSDLGSEIKREGARLRLVEEQIREVKREQRRRLREDQDSTVLEKIRCLMMLRSIGMDSAWLLCTEFFSWREFRNRREVAGAAGLGGTPYDSGSKVREQGISKAGNARVRARMVELGWLWLRLQPESHLSAWFEARFASGGKRMRRIGIVALARRLLIELWHFVEHGVVPKGAALKS